jgi:hypothetical protein
MHVGQRRLLCAVGTAVMLIVLASGTSAVLASAPVITPVPPIDVVISAADTGCGFAIEANTTVSRAKTIDFFDEDGNLVKELFNGYSLTTYTNVDTGRSVTFNTSGPGIFTFNPDGSIHVVAPGLQGAVFVEGDLLYIKGHVEFTILPTGEEIGPTWVGTSQSLCTLLGAA